MSGFPTQPLLLLGWPILRAAVVLLVVSALAFLLLHLAGDPASVMIPADSPPVVRDAFREAWGLNDPVPIQYLEFLKHAVRGDLGVSWRYHTSAASVALDRLPATLILVSTAILIAWPVGAVAGFIAAVHEERVLSAGLIYGGMLLQAVPGFWIGILLILGFSVQLRILPVAGGGSLDHLVLPSLALAAGFAGEVLLITRSALLETFGAGYLKTALAKGVPMGRIYLRHALPNAALPLVGTIAIQFGTLIGGSVIIETVFGWPGAGLLLVDSVQKGDFPVVEAIVLSLTVLVVAVSMASELVQRLADPRLRA